MYFFRDTVYSAVYVMTRGLAYATRRLRDKNCVVTRDLFTTRTNDARFVYARVKNCAARLRAPAGHALAILRHFVSSCRGVRRCGTGNQSDSCHVTSGCHSGSGFIMGVAILVSGRRHLGFRSPPSWFPVAVILVYGRHLGLRLPSCFPVAILFPVASIGISHK
ncbi:MAG TPA: hypothetical protein VLS45_05595 [Methylomicrobium sp.]|nr:hypothetical protein [Methylomicrobium sp.]